MHWAMSGLVSDRGQCSRSGSKFHLTSPPCEWKQSNNGVCGVRSLPCHRVWVSLAPAVGSGTAQARTPSIQGLAVPQDTHGGPTSRVNAAAPCACLCVEKAACEDSYPKTWKPSRFLRCHSSFWIFLECRLVLCTESSVSIRAPAKCLSSGVFLSRFIQAIRGDCNK